MINIEIHHPIYLRFVREFKQELTTRNFDRKNITKYSSQVKEFFFFLERKGILDITTVKPLHLKMFYIYLSNRPNFRKEGTLSKGSIRSFFNALNHLFELLINKGVCDTNPIVLQTMTWGKKNVREPISLEEVNMLFDATETLRDKALLALAYGCGLRRIELERLKVQDVKLKDGTLLVRKGKFGKSRSIPLSQGVTVHLRNYLHYEREFHYRKCRKHVDAFLISDHKHPMKGWEMRRRLKKLVERTNNTTLQSKEVTLHTLRHSIATHLTDKGASMEFVQAFLGHTFIDTAHIYSKRRKQSQKIHKAFNNPTVKFNPPDFDNL